MYLFQLASQHGTWLAARQAAAARNIANADTPGFKASDVKPFQAVFDETSPRLAVTSPAHMTLPESEAASIDEVKQAGEEHTISGNDVNLEAELVKTGDIGRMQALDTGIERLFQRMLLSSLKA